jgi:hypothetical protein
MPDYFNNQERILDNVKFNTDEMVSELQHLLGVRHPRSKHFDVVDGRVFRHYKSNQYDKQGFRYDQNITEISLPFQWDEKHH